MKVGVLTAALQELTPREVRDPDPDKAIEDWLQFAKDLGADYIQVSAALHPTETDIPPEAMLDPVANTLDLRQAFSLRSTASRSTATMQSTTAELRCHREQRSISRHRLPSSLLGSRYRRLSLDDG
jgi:hypothetical protein